MKARKENGLLIVKSDFTGAEVPFKRIHAVIHWGDAKADEETVKEHAMVIGGEMENGRYYVLNEFCGDLDSLFKKAIEHKDNLLIEYFHVPERPPGLIEHLHDLDGLTRYRIKSISKWNTPVYEISEPQKEWPTFRDWTTIATILEHEDMLVDDFEACRVVAERLANTKKVEFSVYNVPRLEKARSQPDRDNSPVFRAFVYLIWYLWQSSEKRRSGSVQQKPESWGDEFVNL